MYAITVAPGPFGWGHSENNIFNPVHISGQGYVSVNNAREDILQRAEMPTIPPSNRTLHCTPFPE